jgi:type II secretory pathway pseudopilin PulG
LFFSKRLLGAGLGFSLAEVLITLALIGLLGAFTIPKIFTQDTTSLNSQYTSKARNAAFMIATAFERYKQANNGTTPTGVDALTPYFNYINIDTSGSTLVDSIPTYGSRTCATSIPCLKLHNGSMLYYWQGDSYCSSGSNPTGVLFALDPDGVYGGTTDGPSKTLWMYIYNDGTMKSQANMKTNTQWGNSGGSCNNTRSASFATDPTWFLGF